MKNFLDKHREQIIGTLSCPDRIILKGYLRPLTYAAGMERFLYANGILIKKYGDFVEQQSTRVKLHAQQMAADARVPYAYLPGRERKEKRARSIARRRGIHEGLVCVFATLEPCQSFKIVRGKRRPRLVSARRKCLFLYFYFVDAKLGLIHVRIQTWFPLTIQVYLNGHEWLARRLDAEGLGYIRHGNAFTWLENPARAQELADEFSRKSWLLPLHELAFQVNPLLRDLLRNLDYYWIIDQAEHATDILFRDRKRLQGIFPRLLRHATIAFSAEDILRFFGHSRVQRWATDDTTDVKRTVYGARIKHRIHGNWLKMYDKRGSVLRIETVINQPRHFRVRRLGMRGGQLVDGWFPMAKRVLNLERYAQVARAANHRYLDALAAVTSPAQAQAVLHRIAEPAVHQGRKIRGFNPAAKTDVAVFEAILRGEHAIQGLRNADLRKGLDLPCDKSSASRKASAWASRVLRRLHVHGLIAKVPRSRRWRPTKAGLAFMGLAIRLHDINFLAQMEEAA
jgi:hypothetical protein